MGPRAVPAWCTNLRGNRRRRASAMRTHRPRAARTCNSAAWVRTGAWHCRRPPHPPRAKPPSLRASRTWPHGPAPPLVGHPATPTSEAAVPSPSPTVMSSLSEVAWCGSCRVSPPSAPWLALARARWDHQCAWEKRKRKHQELDEAKLGKTQTTTMLLTVRSTPDACVFSRPTPTARPPCRPRPPWRQLRRGPEQHLCLWPRGQRHLVVTLLLQLRPDHAAIAVAVCVLWGRRERKTFFLLLHPYQVVRLAAFSCLFLVAFSASFRSLCSCCRTRLTTWDLA
jgi:hypothetical protein